MGPKSFKFRFFNPTNCPIDSTIGIVAKRRSGKSVFIRNLLFDLNPARVVAFIGSKAANTFYYHFIPPLYIYQKWDEAHIEKILAHQELYYDGTPEKAITFVIDDFGCDKDVMKSKVMKSLFQNGRHLGIRVIIAFQYLKDVAAANRGNFDVMCVLKEVNRNNQRALFDEFFSTFENFPTFSTILKKATADFGVLIQDNTADGSKVTDSVSLYRAKMDLPDFVVCGEKEKEVNRRYLCDDFMKKRHNLLAEEERLRDEEDERFMKEIMV